MKEKIILSFTSHKTRLPLLDEVFLSHLEVARACGIEVCFSCQDDSLEYMTDYQKGLVASGEMELLHVSKDHGSNTKWTLCREAHPDATMVVVDDDWIYDAESIRSLLETHKHYPDAVICRAYRTIPWVGKSMPQYEVRPAYSYPKTVTAHIGTNLLKDNIADKEYELQPSSVFPEHFLGMLYPPHFPNCQSETIPLECYRDDDVFIGSRIVAEQRRLIFAGREEITEDREVPLPGSLWEESRASNGRRTFEALKSVQSDYSAALEVGLGQVYLMTCKKYPLRRESIKKELDRLGIDFIEQYDDGTILPAIGNHHKRINRCHLAKYLVLSNFLESSSSRLTLIEDDIRFLKNISEVADAIHNIPPDFGVCRLSWGVSPYIRSEMEGQAPKVVVSIEKKMAVEGSHWVECPWASTDGCTIMTREVAETLHKMLAMLLESNDRNEVDNSDDMVCRICEALGKPLYAYKPLVCIQVQQQDVERGKSIISKFLSAKEYHVRDIVRDKHDYAIGLGFTDAKSSSGYNLGRKRHSSLCAKVYYGRQIQSEVRPLSSGMNW